MDDWWVVVEDCTFDFEVNLFWTPFPQNALFWRNTIILDSTPGGFKFNINCNYPEAVLNGTLIFENNNITMSTLG